MNDKPTYEELVSDRSKEIMDLFPGTSYEDALRVARRQMDSKR
jgi:hypothetical protein